MLGVFLTYLLLYPAQQVNPSLLRKSALIIKIVVKSVDYEMTTWGRINCDDFDKHFPEANITVVIDKSTLEAVSRRIALFKPGEEKFNVDARAKMTIYYSDNATATLCIGGAVMEFNGKKFKYDNSIMSILGIRAN